MEKVRRDPASLSQLVKDFDLEVVYKGLDYDTRMITIPDVNRPALQLVGFYDYFEPKRLQILGKAEFTFLKAMPLEQRRKVFEDLLRCEIPALIVARNMEIFPELMEIARKHGRTLLRTEKTTVELTSHIIDYLNRALAPQITRHGVLMNIYGQGVLMIGDSGIGKSETAIELLKRGHRLIADLDGINWPEKVKLMQRNWIGESATTLRSGVSASSTCSSCSVWARCSLTPTLRS